MAAPDSTVHEWLLNRLNKPFSKDACLLWPFCINGKGYGHVTVDGKTQRVHRVVYALHNGSLPDPPLTVRHLCGIRECYNPYHLVAGTQSDNEADKVIHQTARRGWAKLSTDDVRFILASDKTETQLSDKFGVEIPTIHNIKIRKTWAWVNG